MRLKFPLNLDLTDGQKQVLESKPNVLVIGPAGTGKTLLTILLSEKLLKEDPSLKIEIIVFTKSLKAFIIESLKERELDNVKVYHLNSWLIESEKRNENVDISIIDEVQDFLISEIELIFNNSLKGIYLLGDSNQQIYNIEERKLPKSLDEITEKFNFPIISLNEIVRFNKGIHNFINEFEKSLENTSVRDSQMNRPEIIDCQNFDKLIDTLIDKINNSNIDETIGVICYKNEHVKEIVNQLCNRDFNKIGFKYNIDDLRVNNLDFINKRISVLTIHSSKGVEFDLVIYPFIGDVIGIEKDPLNHYYVAFSRAKTRLVILYYNNFTTQLKIKNPETYNGQINRPNAFDDAKLNVKALKELIENARSLGFAGDVIVKMFDKEKKELYSYVYSELRKTTDLNDEQIKNWYLNELNN